MCVWGGWCVAHRGVGRLLVGGAGVPGGRRGPAGGCVPAGGPGGLRPGVCGGLRPGVCGPGGAEGRVWGVGAGRYRKGRPERGMRATGGGWNTAGGMPRGGGLRGVAGSSRLRR